MTDVQAFTADQASELTGLSRSQLRYWDKTGFFHPGTRTDETRAYALLYTFRDVVGLRALSTLRNHHRVSLQVLRKIGAWLSERYDTPWSKLRFYVGGKTVVFADPASGKLVPPATQRQTLLEVALEQVAFDVRKAAEELRKRRPDQIGKVVQNRLVVRNAPVLSGTRIPTSAVYSYWEAGASEDDIIREFPRLTHEDVRRAVEFEHERQQPKVS